MSVTTALRSLNARPNIYATTTTVIDKHDQPHKGIILYNARSEEDLQAHQQPFLTVDLEDMVNYRGTKINSASLSCITDKELDMNDFYTIEKVLNELSREPLETRLATRKYRVIVMSHYLGVIKDPAFLEYGTSPYQLYTDNEVESILVNHAKIQVYFTKEEIAELKHKVTAINWEEVELDPVTKD